MSARSDLKRRYGACAVVTGASGGIGRAFAIELAARGFDLVLAARRRGALDALGAELSGRHGVACEAIAVDLADREAPAALLSATSERDVGLLVAAAGFGASGPFLEAELCQEFEMIDVNCRAVAALAHGFGQRFAARGGGGLILMSSLVAFQGVPRAANYAATKAYVQTLAEGLRLELRPHKVDVLAVAPGPIRSGFADRAGMTMSLAGKPTAVARGALASLGRRTTSRPGFLSGFLEASLAPLPRRGRVRIMRQVMASMTKRGAR